MGAKRIRGVRIQLFNFPPQFSDSDDKGDYIYLDRDKASLYERDFWNEKCYLLRPWNSK